MGITGLLPYLKKIHNPINVSKFAGCTVAIDAYCWLHKGAFACADKLALGEETDQFVYYCMKYVNCLLGKNVRPILVFDGCHLPSKADVEKSRRERREIYRKKAAAFLREGKRGEARECLQRCIDISPQMAHKLICACREKGVDCIVAPYEADAQLAYLSKAGIAQVIITEDSDLLPFGCDRVIFKMDLFGNGTLVEKSRLNEVLQIKSDCYTFDKFRYICILSGCDYFPSLPGIGLAKANKVFRMARQPDLKILLRKIPSYLKMKIVVTDEYVNGFLQADNTFLHQLVYNPMQRRLMPLVPYPPDIDPRQLDYAGPVIPQNQALDIALGNIDLFTKQRLGNFDPDTFKLGKSQKNVTLSIWDKNYKIQAVLSEKEIGCENTSVFGKEITVSASFIKKKSPIKRKRESTESEGLKTDSELVSLYDNIEPEVKRCHTDRADAQAESPPDSPETENFKPTPASHKSPHKNRGSSVTAASVFKVATDQFTPREKKVTPTKHNKFATNFASTKAKFNLNAPRTEVRSRYFASKSEVIKSEDKSNVQVEIASCSVKNTSPQSVTTTSECTTTKITVTTNQCIEKSVGQSAVKKSVEKLSGGSVFQWSKFSASSNTCSPSGKESRTVSVDVKEVDSIDLTDSKDDPTDSPPSKPSPKTPPTKTPSPRLSQPRSQCRVSGLARGNKKKAPNETSKQQKNIKEMFSHFAFKKSIQQ